MGYSFKYFLQDLEEDYKEVYVYLHTSGSYKIQNGMSIHQEDLTRIIVDGYYVWERNFT